MDVLVEQSAGGLLSITVLGAIGPEGEGVDFDGPGLAEEFRETLLLTLLFALPPVTDCECENGINR